MSNNNIDWDNLSFADLDRLDNSNIPLEHLDKVTDVLALRASLAADGYTNKELAAMTGQHVNTITNKHKNNKWSLKEIMLFSALKNVAKEDKDSLVKAGSKATLNVSKIWELFK